MNNSACDSSTRPGESMHTFKQRKSSSQESTNIPGKSCKNNAESSKKAALVPFEPGNSADDNRIVPLSGNPFFTCIMLKTQVQSPYQLTIPTSFCSFLPAASVPVVLCSRNKTWETRYLGDRPIRRLAGGWRKFVVDNKLKVGDGCVFELMDDKDIIRFKVQILSGEVPDLFPGSGRNSAIPIVIE